MDARYQQLKATDPAVWAAVLNEVARQNEKIELIASENFTSPAVLEALGSPLTNKYAEGLPGKRYYGGCEYVDVVETLAIDRARQLFAAEFANVQPHAGATANAAVYLSFLEPGDRILGMNLSDGGHLTHGHPLNISGKYYEVAAYGVDKETELLDYAAIRRIALEFRPKMLVGGFSSYPRHVDWGAYREIADEVGALLMVDIAHVAGLVVTGHYPSPVPVADVVTTTTHKTLRGPRGGLIVGKAAHAEALNKGVFPGIHGGPMMHVIAAKAVCFLEALQPSFVEYSGRVIANARVLAARLAERGFRPCTGGTDNHIVLIDLTAQDMSGKKAERLLDSVGITINKNTIPRETRSPLVASGMRLGSSAMTTRGFGEAEFIAVADLIAETLEHPDDDAVYAGIRDRVRELCVRFPIYDYDPSQTPTLELQPTD